MWEKGKGENAAARSPDMQKERRAEPVFLFVLCFPADCYLLRASSMALAAVLPAPMARMTVAAPVTASPPA